jgi:hypothetical protein
VRELTLCRRRSLTRLQFLTAIHPLRGSSWFSSYLVFSLRLLAMWAASVLSRAQMDRLDPSSGSAWKLAYPSCECSSGVTTLDLATLPHSNLSWHATPTLLFRPANCTITTLRRTRYCLSLAPISFSSQSRRLLALWNALIIPMSLSTIL